MSGSFYDVDEQDLNDFEDAQFTDGEVVKFQCIDQRENVTNQSIQIKCKILSSQEPKNIGKKTTIFLNSNDNEVSKKIKAQFLKAFWTIDEIKAKQVRPARLVGLAFTAKCRISTKKGEGGKEKTFTNWQEFTKLGLASEHGGTAPDATASAAGAATAGQTVPPAQAPVTQPGAIPTF